VANREDDQVATSITENVLNMWALFVDDVGLCHQDSSAFLHLQALPIETALGQDPSQSLVRPVLVLVILHGDGAGETIERDTGGGTHRPAFPVVGQADPRRYHSVGCTSEVVLRAVEDEVKLSARVKVLGDGDDRALQLGSGMGRCPIATASDTNIQVLHSDVGSGADSFHNFGDLSRCTGDPHNAVAGTDIRGDHDGDTVTFG